MTVIVGTTLRPEDAPMLEVAALLAVRLKTSMRLVHVCEEPRAPLVLGTDQEHLLGTVREDLERQAEELQHLTGATVQPHLASGPVAPALASLGRFELATLIVVGPTTRRLRNTAERVVRDSVVPVLVPRAPERFTAWLRDGDPLRILVGADLGRAAQSARRFAMLLGTLGPTEVEVALIASPTETHARLGLAPPDRGLSTEAESALLRELATSAPAGEACSALRVVSGHGRPDAHLVTRADEGQFDAVVVGLRPHSLVEQVWRGSVARGVLQSAPVTVASVPAPVGEVETSFRPPQIAVVGMDFDESSHRALAHAIGHAVEGATVHVAHVLGPYALTSERGQAREDAWYRLSKLDRGIALERSISIETHMLEGIPAEQLLALSARVGADLLVLGTRKRSAVSRVLMGSVARAVIEESRCPVLVVPARSL